MIVKELEKLIYCIELEFDLINKVKFVFVPNKYDKESISYFKDGIYNIEVGIKDYSNIEKITEKQYNHICNTVLHELIHSRNFYLLSDKIKQQLGDNKRTLAHYAWKILDEYSAYTESNQRFPETFDELNGNTNDVFNAFTHMTRGRLLGATDWEFYNAFCDYCSALIARYVLDKDNLLSYNEENYKSAIEAYINDLKYSYDRMPLSYEQYESLGRRLINNLLALIPQKKQKIFKCNTHILNLK